MAACEPGGDRGSLLVFFEYYPLEIMFDFELLLVDIL